MIQPETVSIEISDPVTADIAYTIDPLSPAESEAIDMAVRRMMKLSSKTLNIQTKEYLSIRYARRHGLGSRRNDGYSFAGQCYIQ